MGRALHSGALAGADLITASALLDMLTENELGALVSVFYVASGVCQFGAGFAVDRFGARPVLLGGLSLLAGGALLAGLVPGFYW